MNSSIRLLWPVGILSCSLLGFEIALMRMLLYASWHHFAFFVISIALLGFGASGTALCLLRRWVLPRGDFVFFSLVIATAASMPGSVQLAEHVPAEARFLPPLLARQILSWGLYWAVFFVPFLLGAMAIGLALMMAGKSLPAVYATNLAGSAMGAIFSSLLMHHVPPAWLGASLGGLALAGALPLAFRHSLRGHFAVFLCVAGNVLWLGLDPPEIRVDSFKYQTYVERLCAAGKAERIARAYGPRGQVEVYGGSVFHELPFLSTGESPPSMLSLVVDGHWAGSVLQVADAEEARVVDQTLMSVPYAFLPPGPRVLLLGEVGGANIWLAVRNQAPSIEVVQSNDNLIRLLRGPLEGQGGQIFSRPEVSLNFVEPRHFVGYSQARFDLIQLAGLESWAADQGGVGGLRHDYLVTVEGLAACLRRLSPDGILAVGRGIQFPPRDNAKLAATLVEALRRLGVDQAGRHLVVVRDFLAACTLVKTTPWTSAELDSVRRLCAERQLTPVYFAGIRSEELNRPDQLPGPPGSSGDWLHYVIGQLVATRGEELFEKWPFEIRPATDMRPYFAHFGKLDSIGILRETFGNLWLTRTELGMIFVFAAIAAAAMSGALMTLLPIGLVAEIRRAAGRWITAAYFASIGLAYLTLQVSMLSHMINLIGDPVQAGAATLGGFLLFSGAGSLAVHAMGRLQEGKVRYLFPCLILAGFMEIWMVERVVGWAGLFPEEARILVAVLAIAPLGFLMGMPMPLALRCLQHRYPALLPWAWGVNGFASVLAPPLATAVAMAWGLHSAGTGALLLYALAAVLFGRLTRATRP